MALILAATPLGNPKDASARLMNAIATADVIAAEDSRRFHRLASDLGVTFVGKVISFFDGNEEERTQEFLELLRIGKNVLVVSDAGMPTISDPGFRLARDASAENIAVQVLPGPSAVTMAVALSGLPTDRFSFDGFPPRTSGARKKFYESFINFCVTDIKVKINSEFIEALLAIFLHDSSKLTFELQLSGKVLRIAEKPSATSRLFTSNKTGDNLHICLVSEISEIEISQKQVRFFTGDYENESNNFMTLTRDRCYTSS
jgi:16S rRNA C1402 (ribose-2'-O) methylase RsmI